MAPVSAALALLCCVTAAELQIKPNDWPQFRGPFRNGFSPETGLLKSWPDGGPKQLWTSTGRGGGYSSVAVVDGTVFGTGKRTDGKEYIWALDEATGKEKWAAEFSDSRRVGYNDGPRGTPTFANGKLYAVSTGGTLACVDANTGKLLWEKSYTKDFGGSVPGWGYTESVLVDDGKVVCTPGSASAALVALNANTGEVVWKTEVKNPGAARGYASMVKAEVGGVPMYVTLLGKSDTAGVVGVDARTGKLLWHYDKMMNTTANIPSPVVKGDIVFCSTGYGAGAARLRMVPGPDGTVSVKELNFYSGTELQNHHGGMTLMGDYIYLGSQHSKGFPVCVNIKTGEIEWAEKGPVKGGDGSASTAGADGRVYFYYQNGLVALIKADPKQYEVVSTFKLPQPSNKNKWPHPAIADGKLYLRDQDKLHCFDIKGK
jgi:outer membrane protein assembly factor BamB